MVRAKQIQVNLHPSRSPTKETETINGRFSLQCSELIFRADKMTQRAPPECSSGFGPRNDAQKRIVWETENAKDADLEHPSPSPTGNRSKSPFVREKRTPRYSLVKSKNRSLRKRFRNMCVGSCKFEWRSPLSIRLWKWFYGTSSSLNLFFLNSQTSRKSNSLS